MKSFNYVKDLPELVKLQTEEIDGSRFYCAPSGKKLPSITTVLGYHNKEGINRWRSKVGFEEANKISNRAATRGTKFHNLIEKYLSNQTNLFENIMPDMKQAFTDSRKVLDRIDNIHYIEAQLFSENLGVAGRVDAIAEFDGKLSIIDFKTSRKIKKEEYIQHYFEQATAYSLMYEEFVQPIEQIVIIISCDDLNEPLLFIKNKNDYIESLKNKIEIYRKDILCF